MPIKPKPTPLKHRDLLSRLKKFDIIETKKRGKGSESVLCRRNDLTKDNRISGPFITIKNHGDGTEHSIAVINTVLRRFNITSNEFWINKI